jgi:hypothetical protein
VATWDNAKRIVKDSAAIIDRSGEGIYDDNFVVLFWECPEARYVNECVCFLNDSTQSVVAAGSQFADVPFADALFHLHAYYDEQRQRIYRVLMRHPISYLADNWSVANSKWKLYGGETFTHGPSTMRVLYMQNVAHDDALAFEEQSFSESLSDSVYLLGGELLDGEWYSIKRRSEVNPKTGLYTIYWYLSEFRNEDLYFRYSATPNITKGHLFKWDTTEELIEQILSETGFLSNGHQIEFYTDFTGDTAPSALSERAYWYKPYLDRVNGESVYYDASGTYARWHNGAQRVISAVADVGGAPTDYFEEQDDPANEYIAEGSAWSGTITLTDGAGGYQTLADDVSGRNVVYKRTSRDENDRLFDWEIELTWSTSQELYSRIYSGKNVIKGNYYKWGITEDEFDELFLHSLFDNSTGENIGPPELIGVSGAYIGDISNKDIGYLEHDDNGRAIFKSADDTIALFHSDYTGTGKWYFFETVTSQFLYEAESDASLPPNTGWVTIGGTGTLTWVGLHFSYPTDVSALWEATTGRTVGVRKLARAGSDGLFDAEIEIVWVTGSSKSVTTAGQILFTGTNITPDSSTEVCMKADGSLVTWSAFKTYLSALRVSPRVQLNPDGTLNYEAVARVEGDALTLRYSPNDHLLIDRTFGYGLDEEDIQNVLENTSVVPPTSFITGS